MPLFRLVSRLALLLLLAPAAMAQDTLLRRGAEPAVRRGKVERVAAVSLDAAALGRLRQMSHTTLRNFPLGATGDATLEIVRFDPFRDGAAATLMTDEGPESLPLPGQAYFRGRIEGNDDSHVLIVAGDDFVRGFVDDGKTTHRFGPDRSGQHVAWSLSDADAGAIPNAPLCDAGAYEAAIERQAAAGALPLGLPAAPVNQPNGPYSPTLLTEIYLDTDQEFLELFVNPNEALAYLADLAAAVSAIYDADSDVRILFRGVRLWQTTDPWKAQSTGSMLDELTDYWMINEGSTARDLVHFLSGKGVRGGVAFLDALCSSEFGYGVSTVYGSFDVLDPSDTWDVVVVAHELGHNFGSPHTHCYDPPIDSCYAAEGGCYDGATSLPPGGGTIMSYCHLLDGGDSNINLTFGSVVSDTLRNGATAAACVGAPCGDGILDPGEACDDGNLDNGDCCSADCSSAAVDGTGCDDDRPCTENDQCTAGTCGGSNVSNGIACDDGSLCTNESCTDGACVAVAAPDTGCLLPTTAQAAQLSVKNVAGGRSDAVAFKWKKGAATTKADFGDPINNDDYELCLYDADADVVLAAKIPAGGSCDGKACWKDKATGFSYSDKEQTPDGISKLTLKAGTGGKAQVAVKGKGAPLPMTPIGDYTLPVTAQLRRDGRCWEATFSTASKFTDEQLKAKSD